MNVFAAGPDDGTAGPLEVDATYLRPNGIITSEDDRVKTLAKRVAA